MNGQEIVWQILKAFEDFQLFVFFFFLSISVLPVRQPCVCVVTIQVSFLQCSYRGKGETRYKS